MQDDDSVASEESAMTAAKRKSSVFTQKRQFRQTFNAQFAGTANSNPFSTIDGRRRGALLKKQSSLTQTDFYNEEVGVARMEKYFGQTARNDFFGRYHWLATQRRVVDNCNEEVLSKTLFDVSPSPTLDFPFAPRRPDQIDSLMFNEEPGADDANSLEQQPMEDVPVSDPRLRLSLPVSSIAE